MTDRAFRKHRQVLAALMSIGVLAGCGGSSGTASLNSDDGGVVAHAIVNITSYCASQGSRADEQDGIATLLTVYRQHPHASYAFGRDSTLTGVLETQESDLTGCDAAGARRIQAALNSTR